MGTNVMLHGQSPASLNSVGKPKWIPIQVDSNGALVSGGSTTTTAPGGGTHDFATGGLTVTVAGTAQTVVLAGVALPRTLYYTIGATSPVLTETQGSDGGAWFPANFGAAGVLSASAVHTLDSPVYAIRFTRQSGANSSTVVIA
jgi:hypothetical protein